MRGVGGWAGMAQCNNGPANSPAVMCRAVVQGALGVNLRPHNNEVSGVSSDSSDSSNLKEFGPRWEGTLAGKRS